MKADSHAVADCSDPPINGQTAIANYSEDSPCTSLAGAVAVTGNNDGCGSSNCDIHWYFNIDSCNADPQGREGDIPFAAAINGGTCIGVPEGATYMRTVCA